MQASNIPSKVPLPFANSGTKNAIPTASQIGVTPGAASLTDGFPPLTMTPLASGGVPPAGADFNGILNLITAIQQWQSAGGNFKYDSAFSTSVGGYPKGAVLVNSTNDGMWFNLADNNTTNPDATDGSAANWAPIDDYGATSLALTNANVTLTPAQFSKPIIVLTGALTGNVQLTMPKLVGTWYVVNSTTGAFTVSMLTSGGTLIQLAQGGAAWVRGDGTNVLNDALQIAPATQSQHAVQLGQVAGVVGSARNLAMSVTAASATATLTADEIVVESALGGLRYCLANFNKTINLATTGAGGMDTGRAPVSGFVALYAIYNPTTGASALLARNATSAVQPNVYGGANMPAGYMASALVSVWPTNGSGQLVAGYQNGRTFYPVSTAIFSTTTTVTSYTLLNISNAVPPNAIKFGGISIAQATNPTSSIGTSLAASAAGIGGQTCQAGGYSGTGQTDSPFTIPLITPQTIYYTFVAPGGTSPSLTIYSSFYEF